MGILVALWRYLPEVVALGVLVLIQVRFTAWVLDIGARQTGALRRIIRIGIITISLYVIAALVFSVPPIVHRLPGHWWLYWIRGMALGWALASSSAYILWVLLRRIRRFGRQRVDAGRRELLRGAATMTAALPFAAVGFGMFVQRTNVQVREVDMPIEGLPKDLHGLRVVHLSDIHLSPFLSEQELARAVDMANGLRADLALVTGDLITSKGDPLDACLQQLARLKSGAGTFGCLGNHEIYAQAQQYATEHGRRLGLQFLRHEARKLPFGNAHLNLAGVDYQRKARPYLHGAEALMAPDSINVLLSHSPDVFDVAAEQGWNAVFSGHTHGGQVTVEILSQSLNIARFYTPYVYGLYRQNASAIYVTRGIGTVGMPARIGAPPEVALIRLCDT